MNDLNRIGIRVMSIVVVVLIIIFGIWKGIAFGISEYRTSQTTPSPTLLPQTSPLNLSEEPLNPELSQQLSTLADSAQETLVGYTKQYVDSLPANSTQEQVLDQKTIEAFVDANRGSLLQDLPAGAVKISAKTGRQAIVEYLDAISSSHNSAIATVTGDMIIAALAKQEGGEDTQALVPIRTSIESNLVIFESVSAPKEAEALHTKLLQSTRALLYAVTLLQNMKSDFVGGLIGQRNLADLNMAFADISAQILALETKYNIE